MAESGMEMVSSVLKIDHYSVAHTYQWHWNMSKNALMSLSPEGQRPWMCLEDTV